MLVRAFSTSVLKATYGTETTREHVSDRSDGQEELPRAEVRLL